MHAPDVYVHDLIFFNEIESFTDFIALAWPQGACACSPSVLPSHPTLGIPWHPFGDSCYCVYMYSCYASKTRYV
jgi:hypothetical protein